MINGNPTVKKMKEITECLDCNITDLCYLIDKEQVEQPDKDLHLTETSLSQQSTCIEHIQLILWTINLSLQHSVHIAEQR